jgi:hypothetical protein
MAVISRKVALRRASAVMIMRSMRSTLSSRRHRPWAAIASSPLPSTASCSLTLASAPGSRAAQLRAH